MIRRLGLKELEIDALFQQFKRFDVVNCGNSMHSFVATYLKLFYCCIVVFCCIADIVDPILLFNRLEMEYSDMEQRILNIFDPGTTLIC